MCLAFSQAEVLCFCNGIKNKHERKWDNCTYFHSVNTSTSGGNTFSLLTGVLYWGTARCKSTLQNTERLRRRWWCCCCCTVKPVSLTLMPFSQKTPKILNHTHSYSKYWLFVKICQTKRRNEKLLTLWPFEKKTLWTDMYEVISKPDMTCGRLNPSALLRTDKMARSQSLRPINILRVWRGGERMFVCVHVQISGSI